MTEPQELRSIDELFKNTFNNLPETQAATGWDTPSERVWDHVRDNIQAPRSGWSLQSLMILAGFAVVLAVGLYFAFSGNEKVDPKPSENSTREAVTVTTVETPVVAPVAAPAPVVLPAPEVPKFRNSTESRNGKSVVKGGATALPVEETPAAAPRDMPRSNGAAPLPGSKDVKIPNTTEALKIEHAKQLEILWNTPLNFLPVPNTKKANN